MPLNEKGSKIMAAMKKTYGPKKGKEVFYASVKKGNVTGVEFKNHLQSRQVKRRS